MSDDATPKTPTEHDAPVFAAVQNEAEAASGADEGKCPVAHGPVGDEPRRAAHLEARRQDLPARGDTSLATAVDDEHVARRDALDTLALRVLGVLEDADVVEVLARRDVAHRERGADQIAA